MDTTVRKTDFAGISSRKSSPMVIDALTTQKKVTVLPIATTYIAAPIFMGGALPRIQVPANSPFKITRMQGRPEGVMSRQMAIYYKVEVKSGAETGAKCTAKLVQKGLLPGGRPGGKTKVINTFTLEVGPRPLY